jgi:hypothetical protein
MDWIDLAQDSDQCTREHGNKTSGSIKFWKIIEQLHNWRLLKKSSVPRNYLDS